MRLQALTARYVRSHSARHPLATSAGNSGVMHKMNRHRQDFLGMRRRAQAKLSVLALVLLFGGCGGGHDTGFQPPPAGVSVQGAWEIVFHSAVSLNDYIVLETNLTQAGTHVFAGAPSALVYQAKPQAPNSALIQLSRLGGRCDTNGTDKVTFDATITNPTPSSETLAFTLIETGDLGSATTTASVSTDGTQISGDYSTPASCGFPEDHGTLSGFQSSLAFVDDFSGTLNNGADFVSAFAESGGNNPLNLVFSGTDNGASLILHGSTVGFAVELNGSIDGQPVKWFDVYNPTLNVFQIFGPDGKLLGSLSESM